MARTDPPPTPVRLAGAAVVTEGVLGVGFAVVLALRASAADLPVSFVLGESAYFAVIGLALAAVGAGLLAGKRGARTPAIVTQLLLLPVVYSLLGPSRQIALGVVTGVFVAATFLLLISERSRAWSMDLPPEP